MSKPTLVAYIVVEPERRAATRAILGKKSEQLWPATRIGSALTLVLPPGISVSGRIVCTQSKEESAGAQPGEETAAA